MWTAIFSIYGLHGHDAPCMEELAHHWGTQGIDLLTLSGLSKVVSWEKFDIWQWHTVDNLTSGM